ncbi:hypothetical protein LOAG_13708 [Loa loa]|uniref:Uncharacterized protein n=1 Tax=Loa loa TaxID=7209 RepID=A0A1S0TIY3_LOALO|nr:hypothetical protein LOAG_13708 [Loa loa]EFO14808.1 hypothetical protein LOAG_13708 [Loa loa]
MQQIYFVYAYDGNDDDNDDDSDDDNLSNLSFIRPMMMMMMMMIASLIEQQLLRGYLQEIKKKEMIIKYWLEYFEIIKIKLFDTYKKRKKKKTLDKNQRSKEKE